MKKLLFALSLAFAACAPAKQLEFRTDDPAIADAMQEAADELMLAGVDVAINVHHPHVTGVSWPDAEQWQIVVDDAEQWAVCSRGAEAATRTNTETLDHTIIVGRCAFTDRYDLPTILRHELGHVLGQAHHRGVRGQDVMARSVTSRTVVHYTASDISWIEAGRR